MTEDEKCSMNPSRREFLKGLAATGAAYAIVSDFIEGLSADQTIPQTQNIAVSSTVTDIPAKIVGTTKFDENGSGRIPDVVKGYDPLKQETWSHEKRMEGGAYWRVYPALMVKDQNNQTTYVRDNTSTPKGDYVDGNGNIVLDFNEGVYNVTLAFAKDEDKDSVFPNVFSRWRGYVGDITTELENEIKKMIQDDPNRRNDFWFRYCNVGSNGNNGGPDGNGNLFTSYDGFFVKLDAGKMYWLNPYNIVNISDVRNQNWGEIEIKSLDVGLMYGDRTIPHGPDTQISYNLGYEYPIDQEKYGSWREAVMNWTGQRVTRNPGNPAPHHGIDWGTNCGTPILSPAPGRGLFAGKSPTGALGFSAVHRSDLPLTNDFLSSAQVHLSEYESGKIGKVIGRGELIGKVGNTGTTYCHDHSGAYDATYVPTKIIDQFVPRFVVKGYLSCQTKYYDLADAYTLVPFRENINRLGRWLIPNNPTFPSIKNS